MVQGNYDRLVYKSKSFVRRALSSYDWEMKGEWKSKRCLQGNKKGDDSKKQLWKLWKAAIVMTK